jgi:hypothetical protein
MIELKFLLDINTVYAVVYISLMLIQIKEIKKNRTNKRSRK